VPAALHKARARPTARNRRVGVAERGE
jgi:hypothetical protein